MIRFAVLGYGFMGVTHASQIKRHPQAELVAVVETNPDKIKQSTQGNLGEAPEQNLLQGVAIYSTLGEMLRQEKIDCISLCLPTHLHRTLAVEALEAGRSVICEKPMALTLEDCDAMIAAAQHNQATLLIAQCLRFWPEYEKLKQYIDSRELGALQTLLLRRVSAPPFWTGTDSWFAAAAKSGGCLFDLHVHDVDFIHYSLGRPSAVFSQGLSTATGLNHSVMTQYEFAEPMLCLAEGSWNYPLGFRMSYTAVFEKGALDYDSGRTPTLTLTRSGAQAPETVALEPGDGYSREYDYFISCLEHRQAPQRITPASARQSIEIALAEARSITTRKKIRL
ncbi:Gfo/Idh/MocA family oxidoreductase [bacterium]|nr:Gfo/Idh/MocA family oxidoreductase [bacterium]